MVLMTILGVILERLTTRTKSNLLFNLINKKWINGWTGKIRHFNYNKVIFCYKFTPIQDYWLLSNN